jgi:thymidylate synthase (FAD)
MNVKLVSLTKPQIEGINNAEDIISYCARVSNPTNQMNMETAPKLIKFLIKHRHWSPFELASMCVEITTSRAIAAQILRHRSFSFQEFSQRYSEAQTMEPVEVRQQAVKNRQSSTDVINPGVNGYLNAKHAIAVHERRSLELYNDLLKNGVAKECARMVLPLTTQTTIYMSGTVRSWVHYLDLRTEENTQKEHREVAEAIKLIFIDNFPNVSEALDWKVLDKEQEQ